MSNVNSDWFDQELLDRVKSGVFGVAKSVMAKTAAIDASQMAPPPGPGADAAAAAGPPMVDPSQMPPGAAPAGAPPADPAAAGAAPPPGDPAAAAAAGAPPMDPSMMGPPPKIEDMAAQGDPIAVFLMEMMSKISNIELAVRGLLKSSGAMVSADALLDDKKPNIVMPKPEAEAGGGGGAGEGAKKTAGVVGTRLSQAAGAAGIDPDEEFDDTDTPLIDTTPDDVDDGLVESIKPEDPLLPKAAKSPRNTVTPLGARAGMPGTGGAEHQPTGLTSVAPRNAGMLRMLRARKSERSMTNGQFSSQGKYRP